MPLLQLSDAEFRSQFAFARDGVAVDIAWRHAACVPLADGEDENFIVWWRGRLVRAGGRYLRFSWHFFAREGGTSWAPLSDPMYSDLPSEEVEIWSVQFPDGLETPVPGFESDRGYLEGIGLE